MKHMQALGMKFIVIAVVLLPIFGFFENATVGSILLISLITTVLSYAIGDLFILPRTGNLIAALADFGLTVIFLWMLGGLLIDPTYPMVYVAIAASLIVAFSEIFFHVHLEANVFELDKKNEVQAFFHPRYLTEFAEEPVPEEKNNKRR